MLYYTDTSKEREMTRTIEIVVRVQIDEDADVQEVIAEMDYELRHPAIKDTEIVDVLTEF